MLMGRIKNEYMNLVRKPEDSWETRSASDGAQ
jgi:hypothetical protein